MSFNFPNAPVVGQLYPTPAVVGLPQYVWDGQAWNGFSVDYRDADDNLAINGGFEVSQEFGATATSKALNAWTYTLDQWNCFVAGSGTFAFQQMALPVSSVMGARGFRNAIRIYCGTAFTMAGSTDLISLAQPIEGSRWARLAFGNTSAMPVTINFWAYSTVAGTMSVGIRNGTGNRCYVTPIVINAAGTWEYKTVTIPGDATGTWAIDNTLGGNVFFSFGAGTGYQVAANAWNANGQTWSHTGVTNFFSGTNNEVWMAGLTIVPGSVGPTAAQSLTMLRQYADDKLLCKRHFFYETYAGGGLWVHPIDLTATPYRRGAYHFDVEMRIAPVMAVTGSTTGTFSAGQPAVTSITQYACELQGDMTGNAGYSYILSVRANARM